VRFSWCSRQATASSLKFLHPIFCPGKFCQDGKAPIRNRDQVPAKRRGPSGECPKFSPLTLKVCVLSHECRLCWHAHACMHLCMCIHAHRDRRTLLSASRPTHTRADTHTHTHKYAHTQQTQCYTHAHTHSHRALQISTSPLSLQTKARR
jgi:hypothetical protein